MQQARPRRAFKLAKGHAAVRLHTPTHSLGSRARPFPSSVERDQTQGPASAQSAAPSEAGMQAAAGVDGRQGDWGGLQAWAPSTSSVGRAVHSPGNLSRGRAASSDASPSTRGQNAGAGAAQRSGRPPALEAAAGSVAGRSH